MAEMKPFGWLFVPRMKDISTIEVDHKPIVLCEDCKQWDKDGSQMGRGVVRMAYEKHRAVVFLCGRGKGRGRKCRKD